MFDAELTTMVASARSHTLGDLLRRSALRYPQRPAVVYGDRAWSYSELDEVINRCANALAAGGVSQGDCVACIRAAWD